MPVAYSYIRFSTPDQLKGDSLRRQLDLSEKYAAKHGFELDETLTLQDLGLSAYHKINIQKGALGVFLQAISDGKIKRGSYLLVESLDRLSRAKVLDALSIFSDIIKAGITIVTLADGMEYSEKSITDNWTQLIISLAIMSRSHEESATKSQRLKSVWEQKLLDAPSKIMTKAIPAWLEIVDEEFIVNEEKANIVREIFNLVRVGYGLHLIERKFNSEAVPILGRSARWYRSYIIKILRGRSVLGEFQPMKGENGKRVLNGDPIIDYYPAIITEEEYYAAHNALDIRTNKGGRKGSSISNVFSGLCKCGYCGGTMRYENKGKSWQYLGCTNAKSGVGCKYILWLYYDFENTILSKLASLDIASVLQESEVEAEKLKLEAEVAKLDEVKKRIRNLLALAEMTDDLNEVMTRLSELKEEEKGIKLIMKELEEKTQVPILTRKHFDQFKKLRETLDSASGDELIDLRLRISTELKRLIAKIEIYPDGDKPWSYGMQLIDIKPGKEGRFAVVFFKSGEARVFHGINTMATLWPGPKSDEGVANAFNLPFSKKQTVKEE
jgi:DNA invertase Pin-like site-specific DNA recombinase